MSLFVQAEMFMNGSIDVLLKFHHYIEADSNNYIRQTPNGDF